MNDLNEVVQLDRHSRKELEKELLDSITHACHALSDIENITSDLDIDIDARAMLDALEHQSRILRSK